MENKFFKFNNACELAINKEEIKSACMSTEFIMYDPNRYWYYIVIKYKDGEEERILYNDADERQVDYNRFLESMEVKD